MRNHNGGNENHQEYAKLMLEYMEQKYATEFTVVEEIFPEAGFNTGMRENILVVADSNGVTANVRARLATPTNCYDDYVNACGANRIQSNLNLEGLQTLGNARLYAVVNTKRLSELNISPEGVASVTLVVHIPQQFREDAMEQLYDAYCQICDAGYQNLYLIAWFTDGAAEFDRAVDNYRVYGKSSWKDYSATVYAALKVTTPGLSYEDFRMKLIEN